MKPYDLQVGDKFKIIAADDPSELVDTYTVHDVELKKIQLGEREVVTGVTMLVTVNEEVDKVVMKIGPWVEVMRS